ncbi:MAG: biotin transporter BioY [Actinobacteria bacterium]|nr:biotin transporter BioY [Actinomycetota bacterium]
MRADAATLRVAVFPRAGALANAVLVLGGAALVALAAQLEIHLGFTPVPITGQTFAVLLVGASLGALRGTASLALYFAAGLVGAPVYSGGEEGWEIVSGATGGYLVGFVVAAAVTGWLAELRWDRRFSSALSAMLIGSVVIYAFGLPWLAHVADLGWQKTFENGLYPFVVGDLAKLWLAAALLPATWRLIERVTARRP